MVAVGGHWFAALIAGPLDRLRGALAKVSAGDLSVDLPRGGSGEVLYLTQMFNTMVESLRKHRGEMERLSITDALTGLTNRRHLMTLLETEVKRSKRSAQPFSVLMLDVDHFKRHNDEYGHLAGDDVLVRLSAILRESLRTYDCAARYGGEEFLVMLSGTGKERAMEVAQRLRARMRSERFSGATVTLSIGVADFPRHGEDAEAVIGAADDALYEAKRAGRDRVVYAREHAAKGAPRDQGS